MKKLYFIAIILFVLGFTLVAQDFTYDLVMPQIRHARIDALAKTQVADTSWYYGFLANPANVGLMGKKSLYPGLTVGLGGPLSYLPEILEATELDDEQLMSSLANILSENNGLDLDLVVSGPIQFGSVKNNFGWGFFNQTYLIANVPSINYVGAFVGNESLLRLAYALPIPLGIGKLSIGGAVDLVAKFEGKMTSSVTELMGEDDFDVSMPLYSSFGLGLDVGASLKLLNFVTVGLVWENALSGALTNRASNFLEGDMEVDATAKSFDIGWKFNLGGAVSVPFIDVLTLGIISSLDVMLDINDVVGIIANDPKERNPILDVSLGTEAVFFKTLSLRLGLHEMYPTAGIGARLGAFNLDLAIFGRELGLEPGSRPQLNLALSLEFFK